MTINLSVTIMHAPFREVRRRNAAKLAAQLQAEGVDPWWACDPAGSGPWSSARKAWAQATEAGGSHHLVLQDDAILCRDFYDSARAVCAARPRAAISLYWAAPVMQSALDTGLLWVRFKRLVPAVALILPAAWAGDFLVWEREHWTRGGHHDDRRLAAYLQARQQPVWAPVPSLVDHGADRTSVAGHGVSDKATVFLGETVSGLAYDWAGEVGRFWAEGEGCVETTAANQAHSMLELPAAGRTHPETKRSALPSADDRVVHPGWKIR